MKKSAVQDIPQTKPRSEYIADVAHTLRSNKGVWYDLSQADLTTMLIDPGVREVVSPDERHRIMDAFQEFVTPMRDGSWFQVRLVGFQHQARYVTIDSRKGIASGVVDFPADQVPEEYQAKTPCGGWVGDVEDGHGAWPVINGEDGEPGSVEV